MYELKELKESSFNNSYCFQPVYQKKGCREYTGCTDRTVPCSKILLLKKLNFNF